MSNSLDPDQAWHFVRPDLGPNCLQRLTADDTRRQGVKWLCEAKRKLPVYKGIKLRIKLGCSQKWVKISYVLQEENRMVCLVLNNNSQREPILDSNLQINYQPADSRPLINHQPANSLPLINHQGSHRGINLSTPGNHLPIAWLTKGDYLNLLFCCLSLNFRFKLPNCDVYSPVLPSIFHITPLMQGLVSEIKAKHNK